MDQSDAYPTGDQKKTGSNPAGSGDFVEIDLGYFVEIDLGYFVEIDLWSFSTFR